MIPLKVNGPHLITAQPEGAMVQPYYDLKCCFYLCKWSQNDLQWFQHTCSLFELCSYMWLLCCCCHIWSHQRAAACTGWHGWLLEWICWPRNTSVLHFIKTWNMLVWDHQGECVYCLLKHAPYIVCTFCLHKYVLYALNHTSCYRLCLCILI